MVIRASYGVCDIFLLIYKEQIQFVQAKENDCRGGWEANSVVHTEIHCARSLENTEDGIGSAFK